MTLVKGKALDFEIISGKGYAKAIVTSRNDYRELAYVQPNGDVVKGIGFATVLETPQSRNDMLTIIERIRVMNGLHHVA